MNTRQTGRHSGNPARETATWHNGPDPDPLYTAEVPVDRPAASRAVRETDDYIRGFLAGIEHRHREARAAAYVRGGRALAFLGLLTALLALAASLAFTVGRVTAASRPGLNPETPQALKGATCGALCGRGSDRTGTPHVASAPDERVVGEPHGGAPQPTGAIGEPASLVRGTASWGWLGGHVVTRLPRGTAIVVCGPIPPCWHGRSWGFGPAAWTGRIADLDRGVFAAICGDPSAGLCSVELRRG